MSDQQGFPSPGPVPPSGQPYPSGSTPPGSGPGGYPPPYSGYPQGGTPYGYSGYGHSEQQHGFPNRSKTPLIIGIVVAIVVVMIALGTTAFFVLRGGGDSGDNGVVNGKNKAGSQSQENNKSTDPNSKQGKGQTVSAEGFYTLTLPAGFSLAREAPKSPLYSMTARNDNGVSIIMNKQVFFTDVITPEGLEKESKGFMDYSAGRSGGQITGPERTTTDGHPVVIYTTKSPTGVSYVAYIGVVQNNAIRMECNSYKDTSGAAAKKACNDVIESMKIG